MTANDMSYLLKLKFDSEFEYAAPPYDDKQVSKILTSAQKRIVEDLIPLFETNEQVRRKLEQLIKSASIGNGITLADSATEKHPNGTVYTLPTDFYIAVEEAATLTGQSTESMVKPVTHDFYTANVKNPYKKPSVDIVWRMDISRVTDASGTATPASAKRTELITNGTAITGYRMRYLRIIPDIVVDETTAANQRHCVLDESLHEAIVDEAVKIMKAAVTPETYQIGQAESNENKL